ncbi:MAG: hypothetical protein ACKOBS_02695 [Verrucomicrobiota bacterium]
MRTLLLSLLLPLSVLADGTKHTVTYPASEKPGELIFAATYTLWIPEGVKTVRGIIVHQHGCGEGSNNGAVTAADDLHWQALARKWDCALLGPVIHQPEKADCRLWSDPRQGSGKAFLKALKDLGQASGHPELSEAPWCLWGHSGGGSWASILQAEHPERIIAIWFRSGTAYAYWQNEADGKPGRYGPPVVLPPKAYGIPMVANPGVKEKGDKRFNGAWTGAVAMFKDYRSKGAPIAFAPDPLTSHQTGDQRYACLAFFDACLALRLPERGNVLRPVDLKAGVERPIPGLDLVAGWLPAAFVPAWEQYVRTGATEDRTPPPAPFGLKTRQTDEGVELTWDAHADFESGLRQFLIKKDGQVVGRVPERLVNPFGRPLFQGMSYGDTPTQPLAAMRFVDKDGRPDAKYEVVAVNSVGLESK